MEDNLILKTTKAVESVIYKRQALEPVVDSADAPIPVIDVSNMDAVVEYDQAVDALLLLVTELLQAIVAPAKDR
jgi:hypothetical protein